MFDLTNPATAILLLIIVVGALLAIGILVAVINVVRARRRSRYSMPHSATDLSKFGADLRRRNENGRN